MPMWAIVLTVAFSGIIALVSAINFFRSLRFATKDDILKLEQRLEKRIDIIGKRIDRHLEGHP